MARAGVASGGSVGAGVGQGVSGTRSTGSRNISFGGIESEARSAAGTGFSSRGFSAYRGGRSEFGLKGVNFPQSSPNKGEFGVSLNISKNTSVGKNTTRTTPSFMGNKPDFTVNMANSRFKFGSVFSRFSSQPIPRVSEFGVKIVIPKPAPLIDIASARGKNVAFELARTARKVPLLENMTQLQAARKSILQNIQRSTIESSTAKKDVSPQSLPRTNFRGGLHPQTLLERGGLVNTVTNKSSDRKTQTLRMGRSISIRPLPDNVLATITKKDFTRASQRHVSITPGRQQLQKTVQEPVAIMPATRVNITRTDEQPYASLARLQEVAVQTQTLSGVKNASQLSTSFPDRNIQRDVTLTQDALISAREELYEISKRNKRPSEGSDGKRLSVAERDRDADSARLAEIEKAFTEVYQEKVNSGISENDIEVTGHEVITRMPTLVPEPDKIRSGILKKLARNSKLLLRNAADGSYKKIRRVITSLRFKTKSEARESGIRMVADIPAVRVVEEQTTESVTKEDVDLVLEELLGIYEKRFVT